MSNEIEQETTSVKYEKRISSLETKFILLMVLLLILFTATTYLFDKVNKMSDHLSVLSPIAIVDLASIKPKVGATEADYQESVNMAIDEYAKNGFIVIKSNAVYSAPEDLMINVEVK